MATLSVNVARAEEFMTHAEVSERGILVVFADGARGTVPFSKVPVASAEDIMEIELPNAWEFYIKTASGEEIVLPWDFIRGQFDQGYRRRMEAQAASGRRAMGRRIRRYREAGGLTPEELAVASGVEQATLSNIENGELSPRYETLVALSDALSLKSGELFKA